MNPELENLIQSIVKANPNARINVTSTVNPDEEGATEKEIYSYTPSVSRVSRLSGPSTDASGGELSHEERRRRAHKVFNVVAESLSSAWVECLKRFIMFVEPKYGGSREELRYLAQVAFSSTDELPEGYYYADEVIDSDENDTDVECEDGDELDTNTVVDELSIGTKAPEPSGMNVMGLGFSKANSQGPSIPKMDVQLPWLGCYNSTLCHALRRNYGLYTQCENRPRSESMYCSRCIREARGLETTTKWGTVEDRMSCGVYEYVDPRGKKPVSYLEFLEKRGHSFEDAYMKARSQGTRMCKEYIQEYEDKQKGMVQPHTQSNPPQQTPKTISTPPQEREKEKRPRLQRLTDSQFEELMASMPPEEEAMFRKRRAEIKAELSKEQEKEKNDNSDDSCNVSMGQ